jgi:hypothetical protein
MLRSRLSSLALTLLLLLLLPGADGLRGQPCFVRGDANADGEVDLFDSVFLLCYNLGGGPPPSCKEAADFNDDGGLDLKDSIDTMKFLFTSGPPPCAPYPLCGPDPDPGQLSCLSYPPCPVACVPNTTAPVVTIPTLSGLAFTLTSTTGPASPGDTTVCADAVAKIAGIPASGLSGWTLSIKATGACRILSGTTAGLGLPPPDFEKTEVTDCGRGLTSRVVFDQFDDQGQGPVDCIPAGAQNVLNIHARRNVSGGPCSLLFQDGQQCSGLPVANKAMACCGQVYRPQVYGSTVLLPPILSQNTPALGSQEVRVCHKPWVWVTFASVSVPGTTKCVPSWPPPSDFKLGPFPVFYFKITTTATYSGPITVCFRLPCAYTDAQVLAMQLWHKPLGCTTCPFTNVTTSHDTCAKTVCGKVTSFSEFALTLPSELADGIQFRRGDVNGDEQLDIADPVSTFGCLFLGTECSPCPDAIDANDDGTLDLSDGVWLLNFLFQGGGAPPSPGPLEVGPDPTMDSLGPCSYPIPLSLLEEEDMGGGG